LYEHVSPGTAPAEPVYGLPVSLVEEGPERMVIVGSIRHTLDQARDLAATILAAVHIGEQRG
jgi:hypothetical protein